MNLISAKNDTDYIMTIGDCITNSTLLQCSTKLASPDHELNISGLFFLIILAITVMGNSMVIVAVIRFKTLHSAINYLIFGLAVADLLVGLFVMPFAVYVHVQGGYWYLGSMMCDIYSASDVACSTASILLLTVISFDRYRAVTHPISYSHKSHDTKRVIFIMAAIWIISLVLASPMVLGVNIRPSNVDPYECRFYNPIFSISSSIISFVIPCFIILFVYIKIMIVLHRRQNLSKKQYCSRLLQSKKLPKKSPVVSIFSNSDEKAVIEIVETREMARSQLPIYSDMNELNLGKGENEKFNLSKIAALNLYKIDVKKSKNGMRKLFKQSIDNTDISVEESSSGAKKLCDEKFLVLTKINYNRMTSPCQKINRFLRNDFISKESSVAFPEQLEVGRCCDLRNINTAGKKMKKNLLRCEESETNMLFDEEILQDKKNKTNNREQKLFNKVNTREGRKMGQLKPEMDFLSGNFLDSKVGFKEDDIKEKQYDKQKTPLGKKTDTRVIKGITKQSSSLDKAIRKTLKKYGSSEKELSHLSSADSKNSNITERTSTIFRKPFIRGGSLTRRHCSRIQRLEKRATKTLAIVVGIFLICWVPFFSVYILNAVCIQIDIKSCQVDFYIFFYTTWLGYINSCLNPIIYTIFNVEFRRAFKCIIFEKDHFSCS